MAAGSNLILFITGNGSITNFPFVPTLKFVTTTGRFELLANEMDVNAGRYNDGMEMDALGAETFELALDIASGQRSKGELAGHAQVSVWRDWPRTGKEGLEEARRRPVPNGQPLAIREAPPLDLAFDAVVTEEGVAADQIALVMPTSLCSGQVARLIAEELDANPPPWSDVSRFVALVHTEGCGSANGAGLYLDTLTGHLAHRNVRHAVLLEHGCEMTHNDAVRNHLAAHGVAAERFGWASVQLDGGIASVQAKVTRQLEAMAAARAAPASERRRASTAEIRVALAAHGPLTQSMGEALGRLATGLVAAGATVVVPDSESLLGNGGFRRTVFPDGMAPSASLAFGRPAADAGFHIMETPTENPVEAFTGLGATGVDLMLCHVGRTPLQGHPMLPLVQVTAVPEVAAQYGNDLDRVLVPEQGTDAMVTELATLIADVASCRYRPTLWSRGVTEFQLTRGRLGLSM